MTNEISFEKSKKIEWKSILKYLGALWTIIGFGMLISILPVFFYADNGTRFLAILGSLLVVIGVSAFIYFYKNEQIRLRDGYILIILGYFSLSFWGGLPFHLEGLGIQGLDCWFEATSAATLNGLSCLENPDKLPHSLQFWRILIQFIGAVCALALGIALLPQLGGTGFQLLKVETVSSTQELASTRARHDVGRAILVLLIIVSVGTILFLIQGLSLFDAVTLTISVFSTGGLHVHPEGLSLFHGVLFQETILVLMLLSSLSFVLLLQVLKGDFVAPFRSLVFRYFIGYYAVFTVLILVITSSEFQFEWSHIISVAIQTASAVTTNGLQSSKELFTQPISQLLLILVMWFGGMAGALSGGIKFHRIFLLTKQIRSTFRKSIHPNAVLRIEVDGRFIHPTTISDVLSFLSVAVFFAILLILLLTWSGLDWVTSISGSIAALSGGGFAFGTLTNAGDCYYLSPFVKWLLMFGMVLGRIEYFALIALLTRTFWRN